MIVLIIILNDYHTKHNYIQFYHLILHTGPYTVKPLKTVSLNS